MLTVLCTDSAISSGRDPRVFGRFEGISGKDVQLVSANLKGASRFVTYLKYLKFCLYHVHDARRKDVEVPGGLALNVNILNQCRCFKTQ